MTFHSSPDSVMATIQRKGIDDQWIDAHLVSPSDCLSRTRAKHIVRTLGGLSPFWLTRQVLVHSGRLPASSHDRRGRLSVASGSARILLTRTESAPAIGAQRDEEGPSSDEEGPEVLAHAFLLPVRWRSEGDPTTSRVPIALGELAQRIVDQLRRAGELDATTRWWLDLDDSLGGGEFGPMPDLSRVTRLSYESAWATLAATLIVNAGQGRTLPQVWATGCWDPEMGVTLVDDASLARKCALAHAWGAESLYVPFNQIPAARRVAPDGLELRELRTGTKKIREALASYLFDLEDPPRWDAEDPIQQERCVTYYLKSGRVPGIMKYYQEQLMMPIIERCRTGLQQVAKDLGPRGLITVLSFNVELIIIIVSTIRATSCLVIHNGRTAAFTQFVEEHGWRFEKLGCTLIPGDCGRDGKLQELTPVFQRMIRTFQEDHDLHDEQVYVDLTPGFKVMSLALNIAAPGSVNRLYLSHRWDETYRTNRPLTEQVEIWSPSEPSPPETDR